MTNAINSINEIKTSYELTQDNAVATYCSLENKLSEIICTYLNNQKVTQKTYGPGTIVSISGTSFENIIVSIDFAGQIKKFSLYLLVTKSSLTFENADCLDVYNTALSVHNTATAQYLELDKIIRQTEFEAKQKAETEKLAEQKYQLKKDKAIKEFNNLVVQAKNTIIPEDAFYYAIGWLANNISSVSAALPDYLENIFVKHFGTETSARIVDSRKRTVNGNSMQWTFGFKASLKNKTDIPASLTKYLSSNGKAIANTSFLWNLIDNYGFQFGKTQDITKIRDLVPVQYIESFEEGLTA